MTARLDDPAGFAFMLPSFDPFSNGGFDVLDLAVRAEAAGFDSVFVGDHLRSGCGNLDAMLVLAGAAARTERVRLGFAILLLAMRDPAWTAKSLGTLEAWAPGRVVLGVGVGGEYPEEWEAVRVPTTERGRRTDELIPVVQALLRGEAVDHPGPLVPVRSPALDPVPGRDLPLMVGGRADVAIRRAARFGGAWAPVWVDEDRLRSGVALLDELREEAGEPLLPSPVMVFTCVTDDVPAAHAAADRYIRAQYGIGFDRLARWSLIGDADHVAGGLQGLVDAGATGFVLVPMTDDPGAQVERLAELRPSGI